MNFVGFYNFSVGNSERMNHKKDNRLRKAKSKTLKTDLKTRSKNRIENEELQQIICSFRLFPSIESKS